MLNINIESAPAAAPKQSLYGAQMALMGGMFGVEAQRQRDHIENITKLDELKKQLALSKEKPSVDASILPESAMIESQVQEPAIVSAVDELPKYDVPAWYPYII